MTDEAEDLAAERERVAQRLRRIRDGVRERALTDGTGTVETSPRRPVETSGPLPAPPRAKAPPPPTRPDGTAVNDMWQATPTRDLPGVWGRVTRLLRRLLAPSFEAQAAFNSKQVQLDNELLDHIDARLDATHRHYDAVLGQYGRHMAEIDERHMILQEELVAHVHELVERVDLVLSEAERGRLSLEFALQDIRARLTRLEERLERG